MRKVLIILLVLLSLGVFVLAAGSSTGGGYPKPNPATPIPTTTIIVTTTIAAQPGAQETTTTLNQAGAQDTTTTLAAAPQTQITNCEDQLTALDRIRCRLETNASAPSVPEQCRGIPDTASCVTLHKNALPCYSMPGIEKDKCLRKMAGVGGTIADGLANNKAGMRLYAVLLNYDLQEKIEDAYANGKVDKYAAASMIDDIVQIKKALLESKTKDQILPLIETLKSKMKNSGVA